MIIRRMRDDDLKQVAVLHMNCFNEEPYGTGISLEAALKDLENKLGKADKEHCLVAEKNRRITAYLVTRIMPASRVVVFGPLGVDKDYRGRKLGLVLVEKAMKSLKEKGFTRFALRIDKKAKHLTNYYSKIGFKEYKQDEKYYYLKKSWRD